MLLLVPLKSMAQDGVQVIADSLTSDSAFVAQVSDSTSMTSSVSAWVVPLAVIGATAGVFMLLFTTRSK
ncbi:MAG: hypothetical protein H6506_02775 [Calditrichaeota bacterium]|nr:hypothetical protein [Calditrichota bacterium]MCB9391558.1 hypothetical protein [Calditrichota bacterium]